MKVHLDKDPGTSTIRYPDYTNWEDLRFPATGINPPGAISDPDRDTIDGTLIFDPAKTEVVMGIAQMPHSWREGSLIEAHIHWAPTDTGAGDVLWRFQYDIANVDGEFSGVYKELDVVDTVSGSITTHQVGGFGSIDMTGFGLSCVIKWRAARIGGDVLDTYDSDAKLLEIDFHYQIGSVGSGEEYTK